MAQWGSTDDAANSVIWAPAGFKKVANSVTQGNLYGNTTANAFHNGMIVGQFAVDKDEIAVTAGNLALVYTTTVGSGYAANAVVTLTFANGTTNVTAVNAFANVTAGVGGHVTLLIAQPGDAYDVAPSLAVAAPANVNITANTTGVPVTTTNISANSTGVDDANDVLLISTANSTYLVGMRVHYGVPAGNTAIGGLTDNTYYYVSFSNTTAIALAATSGGANIALTDPNNDETHTIKPDASFLVMTTANSKFQANDRIYYGVPSANTPIDGLTGNTWYYVSFANTTGIKLSATQGGANLTFRAPLIATGAGETHHVRGETAEGYVVVSGGANKGIPHTGWVLRREGTGGRAGRVSYEVLVAMKPTSDGTDTDDTILPE